MRSHASRLSSPVLIAFLLLTLGGGRAWSQTNPASSDSTYVKLLKKAPESRLGTIIEVVGKRGNAADLAYLLDRATTADPSGFASTPRRQALDALAEAASTRNLRPSTDLGPLNRLIAVGDPVDPATCASALRLAGTWQLESAVPPLIRVAEADTGVDLATRLDALDALARIGTDPARAAIERFAGASAARAVQVAAIGALARLDLPAAADRAAALIAAAAPADDLTPLLAAFLDRQGGSDTLLAALTRRPPSTDGARLALRAITALGRADEALVAGLSKIAGIETESKPPDPREMNALIAEVTSRGDPGRGERIFRRAEINCSKCHALSGAGGGVGPDLSAVGLSSPVDYIINSILIPDQAIKEEYQTRVILTDDGRVLQGIVVAEDERRIILKDALGENRVIATAAIEDSKRGGSLMPKGLVATLTRAEFVDLVRFLAELGRPGPYAIRSTPTIQRYRALHPVPSALSDAAAPDPATFRAAVLDADPSAWVPLYAWTAGHLPISEIQAVSGGPVGVIQGALTVSAAGTVQFHFGSGDHAHLTAWLDDQRISIGPDGVATAPVAAGTRRLMLRVDGSQVHESVEPIRVEVTRAERSTAEFTVVGGR